MNAKAVKHIESTTQMKLMSDSIGFTQHLSILKNSQFGRARKDLAAEENWPEEEEETEADVLAALSERLASTVYPTSQEPFPSAVFPLQPQPRPYSASNEIRWEVAIPCTCRDCG